MLEINDQKRGSGKTTKAIKMLREDENSVVLVPSEYIGNCMKILLASYTHLAVSYTVCVPNYVKL